MNLRVYLAMILSLTSLVFIPAKFGLAQGAPQTQNLKITEIMYDPAGEDQVMFNGRLRSRQWIEFYNASTSTFTILGGIGEEVWMFIDSTGSHFFPKSAYQGSMAILPGQYAVLAGDVQLFSQEYPNYKGTLIDMRMSLQHQYDFVQIKNEKGIVMAQAIVSSSAGANGNGRTLQYYPSGIVTESSVVGGSPGEPNPPLTSPGPSLRPQPSISPSPLLPQETIETGKTSDVFLANGRLVVNEIFTGTPGWLELKNLEDYGLDLKGWEIRISQSGQVIKLDQHLSAQSLLVIKDNQVPSGGLELNPDRDTIQIYNSAADLIYQVEYQKPFPSSWSAARFGDGWQLTSQPSPGKENILQLPRSIDPADLPRELIPSLVVSGVQAAQDQTPAAEPDLLKELGMAGVLGLGASGIFLLIKRRLIY